MSVKNPQASTVAVDALLDAGASATLDPLDALRTLAALRDDISPAIDHWIAQALAQRCMQTEIADALGVSRQAVHERVRQNELLASVLGSVRAEGGEPSAAANELARRVVAGEMSGDDAAAELANKHRAS